MSVHGYGISVWGRGVPASVHGFDPEGDEIREAQSDRGREEQDREWEERPDYSDGCDHSDY